ncbi:MAG: DHH family phosphoesterase [Petrimonas sp.]|jgi:phosphoesterase RecJ-like protein|nr:MAG: Bifunctional oligoribonuclease and PAP phosphatase NrnA [Bacteroidetes bacterium ADurb.BinA174]
MNYFEPLSIVIDEQSVQQVQQLIENSNQILITTHLSPDGDALGASLGLYHFLKLKKKNVRLMVPNSFPYFLKWMAGTDEILIYEYNPKAAKIIFEHTDLIFSIDYNIPKRVGNMASLLENSDAKKVLVDHHLFPGNIYDVVISHPEISSTSELVFRLLYQAEKYNEIDKTIAECIYCGMMADTGGFTFNSNNPEIYLIISLLLRKGINKDRIFSLVYNNLTEDRFRLLGFTLSQRMKVFPELHTALIWLSLEDQKQFSYNKGDTEGFVNYPLSIKDIIFSAFIREDEDLVKMSFRSQGTFPTNEFAARFFHGGGHLNASGGEFYGTLEDAISFFENSIRLYTEELKNTIK